MFMKKLIVFMLIICLLILMVGCGGVPTTPPIISSELVIVRVTDPKSNLISVAGKENEDAMAILGDKDTEGNPTSITGAIYVLEQGDPFGIDAGIDGLPTYLIDSEGNKVIFENYTNSTVDISIYNSNGDIIQEPITINVASADLLELKQLYNSFYSQKRGWGKNVADDVATGLKWGAKAIPWVACAFTIGVASVNPLLIALPPFSVATISCGSAIITALISLGADYNITEAESEGLTAEGCDLVNPLACVSTVLNIIANEIEQGFGTNHAPIISSLIANPSSININETTAIACTASDEDAGDTLIYSWTKNGGTFEGSTTIATVTWRAPSTEGNYSVECEVTDGEASDSESVNISVGDVNHPPIITSIAVTSATKGQPYSYDVNATDSDGDIPVYSLTTNPSGMTINFSTGLISWTPNTIGNYNVTVKASDGELFDTQSFTVTVEENGATNQPPTLTLVGSGGVSPGSGTPSTTFTYSVYYSDPDGALPTVKNVYIDGSSHTMSGSGSGSTYTFQISGLSAGTHTYSFQFSDGTYTVNHPTSGTYSAPTVTFVPQNVTLILYIYENSTSGPPLSGVSVGIVDGGGNPFGQTTNNSGYVTITGTPGTWYFSASKSGYDTNSWNQSITTNCTKYGYIVKSATPVGTIVVFATLDGSAWVGSLGYSLTGPSSLSGSTVPATLSNKPIGSYSITFNSGGPSNAFLSSIAPSCTQTLSEGGIIAFTLNFTVSTLPSVPTSLSPGTTYPPGPIISTLNFPSEKSR